MANTSKASVFHYQSFCTTKTDQIKYLFKWNIENFLSLLQEKGESLKSEVFPDTEEDEVYWFAEVYPMGDKRATNDQVSVYLWLKSSKEDVKAKYELKLLDYKGTLIHSTNYDPKTYVRGQGWGNSNVCTRSSIKSSLQGCEKGTLCLEFEIVRFLESSSYKSLTHPENHSIENMCKDYGSLLTHGHCSDFTATVGGRKFQLHKAILYARSPVFAAMLSTCMEESAKNEVTIDDVDPDVFEKLMKFMYNTEKPAVENDTIDFLAVADKYDVEDLRHLCESHLCNQIAVETAVNYLILADKYNAKRLKGEATEIIRGNWRTVAKDKSWNKMVEEHPELLIHLFSGLDDK